MNFLRALCLTSVLALPGTALASQPVSQEASEDLCFRGGQLQRCKGFTLSEFFEGVSD